MRPRVRSLTLIGRGPLFLSGILAAWLYHRHGDTLRARLAATPWLRGGGADLFLLVVLYVLGSLLRWKLWFPARVGSGRELLGLVPDGVLWAVVLLMVLLCPLRGKALYCTPLLARLGVLSYSIYLVHEPVLKVMLAATRHVLPQAGATWNPITTGWFVTATLACLALASVTYRVIERPFLVRKARLDATPQTPPAWVA